MKGISALIRGSQRAGEFCFVLFSSISSIRGHSGKEDVCNPEEAMLAPDF